MKIVLHPAAKTQIASAVRQPLGSFILHGEEGVGKKTTALDVARQLNCDGCKDNSCRSCKMILSGNYPDLILIEPDEKSKIGISQIQELHHKLQFEPYEPGSHRVVVVSRAETATLQAQNALLKILEEPPAATSIILTSTSLTAMLPTILSRCVKIYLPLLGEAEIAKHVRSAYPAADADAAAKISHGALGRALRYAEDPAALDEKRDIRARVEEFLKASSLFERLRLASTLSAKAEQRQIVLHELGYAVREEARSNPNHRALSAVESLQLRLKSNVNPKTAFEALAVEIS